MPYDVATLAIQETLIEMLEADTSLVALLASKPSSQGGGPAIYEDGAVPQGQLFPYLTLGAWTQVPFHNMGAGYGWNCTGQVKAVGQRTAGPVASVLSAALAVLPEGQALSVDGYTTSCMGEATVQPAIKTTLAGVVTIEIPTIVRVYVQ
jgi:hypothetical protein